MAYRKMGASSARIEVRPYRNSDFLAWQKAHKLRRRKQNKYDSGPVEDRFVTRAAFLKRKKLQEMRGGKKACFIFGVFERKNGAHLGSMDLWIINPVLRSANLGYAIHNHAWSNGYGSEAALLAQEIAFHQLDLHRVEASCELPNKPSARVALKSGMHPEGLRRKYPIPGGLKDLYVFGMNHIDFKKRRRR